MAVVRIPALFQPLAGGATMVRASGATLLDVIDDLERQHPGFRDRLIENGAIRSEVIIAIGSDEAAGLAAPVGEEDEVHLLPAIAGGR
jgi:molybdopterin synthase sulfur carrier subunit